ncbi:peroxidase [Pseudomassariella vexata]|uniref:Peroxidase n=1 Tax=Pseudomassariella vexata TaxID=1141098 RepID=A0A1Y2DGH2_9PEZI|nr:peroxidase [Pseudomassariella vexata]ORY58372.1 peroxidase [Pseudomassariella vexata]
MQSAIFKTWWASLCYSSLVAGIAVPSNNAASETLDRRHSGCPAVWTDIAADLNQLFSGCSDPARQAIRTIFHDCFPGSNCDGSLILAGECTSRPENAQMIPVCDTLGDKAQQYNVSTADMIQAAAALGTKACGGPSIAFKIGRKDSSTPSPTGQLPAGNATAATQIAAFASKGFSANELIALVGAHSAGKNLAGTALDTTVNQLDSTKFYPETQDASAPASLDSDRFLSNSTATKTIWKGFGASASAWHAAFVPAMEKMSVMGNDVLTLNDCSSIIS